MIDMHNMFSNCSVACSDLGEVSTAIVLQRNMSIQGLIEMSSDLVWC